MEVIGTRFPAIREQTGLQEQVAHEIASGPRGRVGGPFAVLLHAPLLASQVQKLGAYLRFETSIPADLRELAILVAAAHWKCGYEWNAHAATVRSQSLLPGGVIESLARGGPPDGLTQEQAVVHRFCVGMHRDGTAGDAAFAAATRLLGHAGVLDLIALCGYFALLAMVLNAADPAQVLGSQP
jgi:4-carboxymuconolactone decarboxylase